MFLGYLQVRQYQKTVKKLVGGKATLGVGQRKGVIGPGELLILAYDRDQDQVLSVRAMKGITVFARFKEIPEYRGLSLEAIRRIGIEKDGVDLKIYRRRHPYDPAVLSKKKGALIQAVEALDAYFKRKDAKALEEGEGTPQRPGL
jgi:glucitol operon activator protein